MRWLSRTIVFQRRKQIRIPLPIFASRCYRCSYQGEQDLRPRFSGRLSQQKLKPCQVQAFDRRDVCQWGRCNQLSCRLHRSHKHKKRLTPRSALRQPDPFLVYIAGRSSSPNGSRCSCDGSQKRLDVALRAAQLPPCLLRYELKNPMGQDIQ